jgi:eukaryotic-like serine/threonine-protein kinase
LFYLTPVGTLMVVPFDQISMKVTGSPTALVQGMRVGRMGSADLAISSNGTLVYSIGAEQFGREVVWVNRDGGQTSAAPGWQGSFFEPALSPDGKSFAVSRSLDGRTGDIWVRNFDRGTSIKLTHEGVMNRGATWTPDGSSVTYSETHPNGDFDLRTACADGTGSPRLELQAKALAFTPRWTPDGTWLLSVNDFHVGGADILGIRPGIDTAPVQIVATKANESEIALSKDGHWLAYDSDESGRDEIYVVPFPHTDSAKWAITSGGGNGPLWSHSGKELFYRGPSGDMFSVALTTRPKFSVGKTKKLFAAPYEDFPAFQGNDVDLNDKKFLMVRQLRKERPDKFVVVENWLEELKAKKH